MPHLHQDDLMLAAFGEQPETVTAAQHLTTCARCRSEVQTFTHLVAVGRQTDQVRDLPPPPQRVWAAIEAQTGLRPKPLNRPIVQKAPWLKVAVAAAVAAVLAAVGTWAALRPDQPTRPTVIASAQLAAFGNTPAQARGTAEVLASGRLEVDVTNLPPTAGGYYEVWLIDPVTSHMFSIGVLGADQQAAFALPPNVDVARYSLVDVSAEQFDNQPAHSGNSLLRGVIRNTP